MIARAGSRGTEPSSTTLLDLDAGETACADPKVSVIVPVRDDVGDITDLLGRLAEQTLPAARFEVLIGDDGSRDGAISRLATADGHIRVLSGAPHNSYAARNRAVAAARAPVLAFCDSDCRPEPTWLEAGLASLNTADVVAGLIRFVVPVQRSLWSLVDIDTFLDQERAVRANSAMTANLFLRRELFEQVGRFDDALRSNGDHDFVSRCVVHGARLTFERHAVVWHPTRDAARPLLRKVWMTNRCAAARRTRNGERPGALSWRAWVPLVRTLRTRRHFGRSLLVDRRRLNEHRMRPSRREEACALMVIYLVLPYLAAVAQVCGWRDGRRLETNDGG